MSHSDSIRRVVEIMRLLNEGQGVTIERLAQKYEVNSRSIRRDLALIKEVFGEVLVKEGDTYRAYSQLLWDQVLSAGELMQLSNVVNLLNLTEHHTAVSAFTRALIKRSQSVYAFKSKPFEQLRNLPLLKQLEHAIAYRQVICLSYQTLDDGAIDYQLKPYKIVFLNENFYLVGVYRHDTGETVKLFRIAMMQAIKRMDKSFIHDREVDRFIIVCKPHGRCLTNRSKSFAYEWINASRNILLPKTISPARSSCRSTRMVICYWNTA